MCWEPELNAFAVGHTRPTRRRKLDQIVPGGSRLTAGELLGRRKPVGNGVQMRGRYQPGNRQGVDAVGFDVVISNRLGGSRRRTHSSATWAKFWDMSRNQNSRRHRQSRERLNGPITDEGVVVGGAFDSDTAVGKCRLRTRAAGVLASQ